MKLRRNFIGGPTPRGAAGLGHGRLARFLLIALLVGAVGCSARTKRRWSHQPLHETLETAMPEDLSASNPDDRRQAVARLVEGRHYDRDDVFYVLDAVARTDPIAQIRCIAIRGLARYEDDRPVGTLLTVLQANENSPDALPANEDVRWESVRALCALAKQGVLTDEQADIAREICIRLADPKAERNVRLTALKTLGYFQHPSVFRPLILALRDEDFAVADQAEESLIALTGTTHAYDATAWEEWLAATDAPFANAGQEPQIERPSGPTWFERQRRAFRRAIKLGNAD